MYGQKISHNNCSFETGFEHGNQVPVRYFLVFFLRFYRAQDEVERYRVNAVIEDFSFGVEIRNPHLVL